MLKLAYAARVSSFDLMSEDVWQLLTEDVAADFPYLTLADINTVMALGRKGLLDTGRALPLNYTRIYKWVKARVPYTLGYWQARHPALVEWAELTGTTAALLAELDTYETPGPAFALPHKFRGLLQKVVRKVRAPHIDFNSFTTHSLFEQYPSEAAEMLFVEQILYPQWLAKYPEQANQHTPIF